MAPVQLQSRREALGNAELAAARGNAWLGAGNFGLGLTHGLLPYGIVIEREFAPHLVFEIGEQLGRALLGRGFENPLALANEPLQVFAFRFRDQAWRTAHDCSCR